MAVDMFLVLDDIEGETKDDVYSGEKGIDVLAWSWGANQSGTMHTGGGGGSGKVSVQDVSVTKYIDSASHAMLLKCCTGEHIPNAKLVVRKAGSDPLEYIVIEMKKVLVGSISTGGSGGEDQLTENVTLNFEEFSFTYTPQMEDGTGGAAVDMAFNVAKNVVI
jgi:type VI secretion system secreted protein Hcp